MWYDGFMEQDFKDSLLRLRDAYVNGYVDKETLTNGTSDVRNKFYEDRCGVFTYWSGTWAENLRSIWQRMDWMTSWFPFRRSRSWEII